MPDSPRATIDQLTWMVGGWQGALDERTVEEHWNAPRFGTMQTAVRLSGPEGVQMVELIAISQVPGEDGEPTLSLELRQFAPNLEIVNAQSMVLDAVDAASVSFRAASEGMLSGLRYRSGEETMWVDVTVPTGDVLTAELESVG